MAGYRLSLAYLAAPLALLLALLGLAMRSKPRFLPIHLHSQPYQTLMVGSFGKHALQDQQGSSMANRSAAAAAATTHPAGAAPLCGRVPLLVQYPATSGLTNQLYAHVAALAVAEGLARRGRPVAVTIPPGEKRSGFGLANIWAETYWSRVPSSTLLDIPAMKDYWAARGILVSEVSRGGRLAKWSDVWCCMLCARQLRRRARSP